MLDPHIDHSCAYHFLVADRTDHAVTGILRCSCLRRIEGDSGGEVFMIG